MASSNAESTATDTTSVAQGRFTVQLAADLRPLIDDIGRKATEAVSEATGVEVELSGAQIVASVIKGRHAELFKVTEPAKDDTKDASK